MSIFNLKLPICHCEDCDKYVASLGISADTPMKQVFCIAVRHTRELENRIKELEILIAKEKK